MGGPALNHSLHSTAWTPPSSRCRAAHPRRSPLRKRWACRWDAVIKTLILFGARTFVAAVLAGNRKLDRRKLANVLGIGVLRLATAREVLEETGYPPGGVAPIGLRKRMPVVIDEDLMKTPTRPLVAGGGREDLLMRISAHEIALFTGAQGAPICKEPGYGL